MQKLNLPTYSFKYRTEQGQKQIFDPVRKKYIALLPEEWVRQNLIQYLIHEKGFPQGLIEVEKGLRINGLPKRADIILNNNRGKALMLVECKAPDVEINQDTFDQIARYNIACRLSYLLISNGLQHYACHINFEENSYRFLTEVPSYVEIT